MKACVLTYCFANKYDYAQAIRESSLPGSGFITSDATVAGFSFAHFSPLIT